MAIYIIIGVFAALLIFLNPFLGLLSLVALMPQSLIPALGGSLFGIFTMATPIKILGVITFAAAVVRALGEGKSWAFLKQGQVKWYILFLLWVLISGFTMSGWGDRRGNFTAFISFLVLGFIIMLLVDTKSRARGVIWACLLSVFVVSLQALLSYTSYEMAIRIRGGGYCPNYFAMGLLPFLGLALYTTFSEKKNALKILALVITTTITIALVLTVSRAGMIGLAAMLIIAALTAKKKFKGLIGLALCVILALNFIPQSVWERFEGTRVEERYIGDPDVDSATRRYHLALAAWQMFLANPVFGVGVGNYYWECRNYQPVHAGRAHTTYLEIMAELGIIGIVLFLGILFYTFKSLVKLARSPSELSGYARGMCIGLAGFLVAAIFLHSQHEKVLWFFVFMSAAMERIESGVGGRV